MINNNGAWLWNTYQWKAETDGVHNPFGYCGEYTDTETGLIYLRNRYYSPTTGRFIIEDPIRDGLNWYAYCGNNPVMFIDYWGFEEVYARDYLEDRGTDVQYIGDGYISVTYDSKRTTKKGGCES